MFRLISRKWQDDLTATMDEVILADSTVMSVPRANLAAAKELLAARKAAQRRAATAPATFWDTQERAKKIG